MTILDGKWLSGIIKEEIAAETVKLMEGGRRKPRLTAVLVGSEPASQYYVKSKMRACKKVGFDSDVIELPVDTSESEVLELVEQLNSDNDIDGYIVQLPLPAHIDDMKVIEAVDPSKDVDGFHPVNLGKLAIGLDGFVPATPLGILQFLERYGIETEGKHAVVLGRSNIVGTPMSLLLSRKTYPGNCTVTQVHSRTRDLPAVVRQADILIAAIGRPHFVTADMVREGAVVIDVGINHVDDPSTEKGYRIVGDVDFDAVSDKASYITPVPGGVGLMTVTSLLLNTLKAYKKRFRIH
jgi:methylenetetrahydrofolate dehydrogenase (NADP+)/methenyltetrahydrofolate cyclohydrolase